MIICLWRINRKDDTVTWQTQRLSSNLMAINKFNEVAKKVQQATESGQGWKVTGWIEDTMEKNNEKLFRSSR